MNNGDIYENMVFRLSIVYLGSIVTLTLYIYNTKQKLSSVEFLQSKQHIWMVLGILFSFIALVSVPKNPYWPKLSHILNFQIHSLCEVAVWADILSILNFISFILATSIFLYTLNSFINSFLIENIIKKNLIKVIKIGQFEKFSNINQLGLKVTLSESQITKLIEALEVFNQNLIYLVELNNSKLIKSYTEEWANVVNYTNLTIFHTSHNSNNEYLKKNLYEKTLRLTNNLVLSLDNVLYKKERIFLLNALLKSLPAQEEFFEGDKEKINSRYEKNYIELSPSYFIELLHILTNLYNSSDKDIYSMLLNGELEFQKAFIHPDRLRVSKPLIDQASNYLEDLFLSILFKILDTQKSEDLSIILALLFSTQSDHLDVQKTSTPGGLLGDLNKSIENNKISNPTNNKDVVLSRYTIKFLILAITKACEIENYKAAGYLVKRLCNHVNWFQIKKELAVLEIQAFQNVELNLLISKISLNNYSLRYCYQKSILLLSLQIAYNSNYVEIPSLDEYLNTEKKVFLIDSLKDRKKDYGLPCIHEDLIDEHFK